MDINGTSQTRTDLKPNESVVSGRYVIDRVIVHRPLLVAYRAYDLAESKLVVLEVLDEALVHDLALMPRLKKEALRAQQLIHDNIVPFQGIEQDGSYLFCTRDYVDGTILGDYLAHLGRPVMFYEAMQVVDQAGMALHYAHRAGILHRSINPQSIVLRYDGRVVLLGFGLPSLTGISSETDVDPVYLSPEQCSGQKVDHHADIYSLAIVAYNMCVGRPPFTGAGVEAAKGSEWERVCWQHVHEPSPFASKLNPDVPQEVSWVLSKALAKQPGERFRSAAEFLAVMKRAWKEADLDPDAMCIEPPPWIREPEIVVPPKLAKSSQPSKPLPAAQNQKVPIFWLVGLLLVVAAVWGVLLIFLFGNFGRDQSVSVYSQGPALTVAVPEYAGVPTWTPPLIPTATETRTSFSVNMMGVSAPTVAVPSGIPFSGLRNLTEEFDWANYVNEVNWRSYTDPRFGFALTYPDGWTVEPGKNALRLYMSERDVGVVVCSCGTRTADAGQWAVRVLELLRNDFPGIEQLEQRIYTAGWLATLARVPQGDDDVQLAILSFGQGQRGYAVVFIAWASDWQGAKPIFDQMAQHMRFP